MEAETCECSNKQHHLRFQYPKNEVPIKLFQKEKIILKTCQDCRNYVNERSKTNTSKNREKFKQSVELGRDLLFCSSNLHTKNKSVFPRNEVPIDLFRKESGNIKSELFTSCKDCRNNQAKISRTHKDNNKILAQENNKVSCSSCLKHCEKSELALNKNGTSSRLCIDCKHNEKLRSIKLKNILYTIKMEFVEKYEASCCLCKNLYLKDSNNNYAIELKTYTNNNKLYIDFDGKQFRTLDFIKYSGLEFELNILEFDHLTEEEQRERELLLLHEEYVYKKYRVGAASSESAMRLEALKCQLLCARCHIMETIRREKGKPYNSRSRSEKEKLEHTNKLKLQGCEICKYKNSDLPRFFNFDHLDPTTKIERISNMIMDNKCSVDDLMMEISKCRIICRHCHLIHTKIQLDKGILNNGIRKT